jgi:hypothetical protein
MWLTDVALKHPISRNFTKNGIVRPIRGLVLHIQEGTEKGTYSWFNNKEAKASSHFGNPKGGKLEQFVDTDDMAWTQKAGNPYWLSVENEGYHGQHLTDNQIHNLVRLLKALHKVEKIPFTLADSSTGYGLGYHSMGGKAWGHPQCPGKAIIQQRHTILALATKGQVGDFPIISGNMA